MTEQRHAVSVCMATYNGSEHVADQIKSILQQLTVPGDELVIVDDASVDSTVQVIEALDDRRIRIVRSRINRGHVAAFEAAIAAAARPLIMLADQDDLWPDGRVDVMARALLSSDVVVGGYQTFGGAVEVSSIARLGPTDVGRFRNIAAMLAGRRPYSGCVMAFRESVRSQLLPFPEFIEAHDHWLGVVGNVGFSCVHAPVVVTLRRLHGSNLTPDRRRSMGRVLATRRIYARMLVEAARRSRRSV